jgi:hypothetical protein
VRKALTTLGLLALVVIEAIMLSTHRTQTLHARLGGEVFVLEVADTEALRTKGLSGHAMLRKGEGMLFVFPEDNQYGLWMKDMAFPIDIVWLDSSYHVVDVKKSATPASYPEILTPVLPARYVVEIQDGFFEKHALKIGDTLEILR